VFTCGRNKPAPSKRRAGCPLFANLQPIQRGPIPGVIDVPQIVQEPTASTDQLQETSSRMVILLVEFEMLGQIPDTIGEYCDLHFRRPGILIMLPLLPNQVGFGFLQQGHLTVSFVEFIICRLQVLRIPAIF
jgi:hypothetical protein